ncbi:MAG: cation:proton antiporter [Candidatus Methanofastidiosa archaeon]|jgi:energy-converting hydrogenase B subunit C|nr:cation:proton antiporter [Candidatus Methanofastidiosa archaeon]
MNIFNYTEVLLPYFFLLSGTALIAVGLGLFRFGQRKNIVYARLHILGVMDVVCMLVILFLGNPVAILAALAHFFMMPFAVHSISWADLKEAEADV